jgi:hypothetical protein
MNISPFILTFILIALILFTNLKTAVVWGIDSSLSSSNNTNFSSINSDSNRSNTVSNSVDVVDVVNVTTGAKIYEGFKKLESPPPEKTIDKESFSEPFEQALEETKDKIATLEANIPAGDVARFNARDVLGSSFPIEANSTLPSNSSQAFEIKQLPQNNVSNINQSSSAQIQDIQSASISKIISKNWKGLDINEAARDFKFVPPDITLAAGPDHIVQIVHSAMKIWNKNGQEIKTIFLDDFYRHDNDHSLSDPIILYDQSTGRWFSAIMEVSHKEISPGNIDKCYLGCSIRTAVSTSSDPTSEWKIVNIPYGKNFPDYPMIGVNNNNFVFGVNVFRQPDQTYLGTQAVIIDKNSLVQETTSIPIYRSPFYGEYYTIYPITSDTDCMYMQANDYDIRFSLPSSVDNVILFNVCGSPSTNDIKINTYKIPIPNSLLPSDARQPNYVQADTDLLKIRGPVYFNNTIISAFNYSCDNDQGDHQSCIRLLKIETDGTNYRTTVKTLSPNDADVFYPSLSLAKDGKVIMIFGTSSQMIYPSILAAIFDKDFKNIQVIPLMVGTGNTNVYGDTRPRFGDYFASAVDPIDGSVWMAGEYGDKNLPNEWSTYIGNLS